MMFRENGRNLLSIAFKGPFRADVNLCSRNSPMGPWSSAITSGPREEGVVLAEVRIACSREIGIHKVAL